MTRAERPRGPGTPAVGPDASIHDLQADIEQTREQLGATVEAIAGKADKARSAASRLAIAAVLGGITITCFAWWRRRRGTAPR
ncbi:DUF3618 domain-containing protein [Mycobacterium sp. E787]|uniref:DUF3618 domain-containing protein n=1 Tax=Mycobacterium sp. E787 TaxID=1834150 RepID=UPI0007FDC6C2|nr:DUF3618 domain-containing protein [Mycobacterium sp. E787]OBI52322.1 hypothetical protein A5705_06045 [Mycobacterium sp. E787]